MRSLPQLFLLLTVLISACSWKPKLKFWDEGPSFEASELKVSEVRRALLCGTPTDAARVSLFDDEAALRAWDSKQVLQLDRIALPGDSAFVLLEQGLRRTGGYTVELRKQAALDEHGTLRLQADWLEPQADRMVTQMLTGLCVLVAVPAQLYQRVEVLDSSGAIRASLDVPAREQ